MPCIKPKSAAGNPLAMWILLPVLFLGMSGCSTINQLRNMQKPEARVQKVSIAGLSFDAVDLLFDIDVRNPNALGIKLNRFDYDLQINANSFLSGVNESGLEIAANGQKTVQLPLTLKFADLYRTFSSLKDQDSSGYKLQAGFAFDVPILGAVRIPVSKSGSIPNVKLPQIRVGTLKVNHISLSGADLALILKVDNPNIFGINLNKLNYRFDVNGRAWGSGEIEQALRVTEKGEGELTIPISLNFMELGMGVYQALTGREPLSYRLNGDVKLGTTLPLLGETQLSFDRDGQITLQR